MADEIEEVRALLRTKAGVLGVPDHCVDGLIEFVVVGRPTGSFLEAVIANDLMDALGRADVANRSKLFEIGAWLRNHAPGGCYGSRKAYQQWVAAGGIYGRPNRPRREASI